VIPHIVDATLFYTPTSGGVRRYLLAKHVWFNQQRLRHTCFVPGPVDGGEPGGIVEFASPRLRAGYRWPVRLAALRARLAALGPDLIEAGDPYVMAWQSAAVADALGIPAVAFCHSDLIGLVEARFGALPGRLAAAYLRRLYAHFQLVFAPSLVVASRLADAGVGPVTRQPLGVDAEIFHPGRRDPHLKARLGLDPRTRLLVFAGRLAPEKNLPELIELVADLGDPYHLLVIGGERAERLDARVTGLPYQPDPAAVASLLASADALVHAGRQETFGLVVLEAMAAGTPVVAYPAGALPELVDESVGRLAASTRVAALAEAVHALFDADVAACGRRARARVLATYTWDAVLRAQVGHYARLLAGAALPRPSASDDEPVPAT
jgi:alpha-1,6-mannosyltransferase